MDYYASGNDVGGTVVLVLIYGLPLILMLGGLLIGGLAERRHFASLQKREMEQADFPAVPTRSWDTASKVAETRLVIASTVVSLDYFKRFLAKFRNIFGGRVRSYESLLDRAKREAILRLKESAPGFHIVLNLRVETANIVSVHTRKRGLGGVEVIAYGTAIRYSTGP